MIYYCEKCKQSTEYPDFITEPSYQDRNGNWCPEEVTPTCPLCGEELSIPETAICSICDEEFIVGDTKDCICPDCRICSNCSNYFGDLETGLATCILTGKATRGDDIGCKEWIEAE